MQGAALRNPAAPSDNRLHPKSASQPAHMEPLRDQTLRAYRQVDGEGADLDTDVAGQLVEKTTSLTISGLGCETEAPPVQADSSFGAPALSHAATASTLLDFHAQPCAGSMVMKRSEEDDVSGAAVSASRASPYCPDVTEVRCVRAESEELTAVHTSTTMPQRSAPIQLLDLPNEVLLHILSYLEVCDLLATSRVRSPPSPPLPSLSLPSLSFCCYTSPSSSPPPLSA